MKDNFVIGLDFGTDSVRAVLVNALNGQTISSFVYDYPRWKKGLFCDAKKSQYRQHVDDHLEGMEITISTVVKHAGIDPKLVKGICIDTTGSSPIPVNQSGAALCQLEEFSTEPDAMMVLWKDHTAISEASEINQLSKNWGGSDFTKYEGGVYSSEWFWAKILHIIRNNQQIRSSAYSWMEHCDWMTYQLTGQHQMESFKRSRCAAGHKAMWHESWDGLPDQAFLIQLDPYLAELRDRLYTSTYTSNIAAGNLSEEWALKTGLTTQTVVSVGTFDAHAGAVGAEVQEFTLVRVMGTSTCDIVVAPSNILGTQTVAGICGQVDGSVIPDMIGLEAGQSAFGDVLAWFRDVLFWPIDQLSSISPEEKEKIKQEMIANLSHAADQLSVDEQMTVALDWVNGRRTPDANQSLKSAMVNLHLGTTAPEIFKALVISICFGSKKIVQRFQEQGVKIETIVGIGGVAKKSPFVMQTLADVLQMPIKIAESEQAPALGAAMYAAVTAGIYETVQEAVLAMGNGTSEIYYPRPEMADLYDKLYQTYNLLGAFVASKINNQNV